MLARTLFPASPRDTMNPALLTTYMIVDNEELRQVSVRMEGDEEAPLQQWYKFDEVFAPGATQLDVYHRVVAPILDDVLRGFKCTIIVYGPMGPRARHTPWWDHWIGMRAAGGARQVY
ncbi:kinesin-like protein KLP2 [Hippocampus comes]|uniref:kinesin-like protein KLP2 n=1 Tax=Hippocampus comes TaxID=109280 RepID=UPI00094E17D5|nr:PREDICTED: kinesin-like protein KLP2 [Hippocampus comes]